MVCLSLTSEVLHKVLQLHLTLRLHVGAVHVRVEEDDGKGQDKDGVWVAELPHHSWVADAVPLTDEVKNHVSEVTSSPCGVCLDVCGCVCFRFSPESFDEAFHLLRFPLDSDLRLEFP